MDAKMNIIVRLIVLLLAAIGVAAIVDYSDVYDVPMIELSKQNEPLAVTPSAQAEEFGGHGFSQEGLDRIQVMMETAIQDGRIMSAIAMVARDGEVAWIGTAGEMGPGVPMRNDAIIPLASVGKMFTATAAMILYERGVISLNDPVSKFIPEFANVKVAVTNEAGETGLVEPQNPVTIYHMLTHTGGLKVTGDDFWTVRGAHVARTTTTEFARALAELPLQSQPGAEFNYGVTGASYEVLAAVIETVSGMTLETFMADNIFEPLGLDDTYFYVPEEKSERMPAFYRKENGELQLERAYGEDFPRTTYFHGGGGVRSAPGDISRFARLFLEGGAVDGVRILSPETIQLMISDHLGEKSTFQGFNGELSWGFGAAVLIKDRLSEDGVLKQYGWVGGNYAKLWIDPSEKIVAYFAFTLTSPGDIALLFEFDPLVYAAMTESYIDPSTTLTEVH